MNDLGQIKANIESLGNQIEIRNFCGLTIETEDGKIVTCPGEAVGEITADFEDGTTPVPIPICAGCLEELRN